MITLSWSFFWGKEGIPKRADIRRDAMMQVPTGYILSLSSKNCKICSSTLCLIKDMTWAKDDENDEDLNEAFDHPRARVGAKFVVTTLIVCVLSAIHRHKQSWVITITWDKSYLTGSAATKTPPLKPVCFRNVNILEELSTYNSPSDKSWDYVCDECGTADEAFLRPGSGLYNMTAT